MYKIFRYFDYLFISYDLGYTKYDNEFYKIPSRETGISPEKILVVDDKKRVVEKAEGFGMKGYHFTSMDECVNFMQNLKSSG
jgi:HAD superfamily hydrolase (TIGR01509 family)